MLTQHKSVTAWGLDIGDRSLKLVGITGGKSSSYNIVNANSIEVPSGFFDNGKIINQDGITDLINKLINTASGPKLRSPFVHCSLPETQTYIKLITIPDMTDKEIPEAVQWASEHHLPIAPEDIYLDWQIVERTPKEIHVLIGAAPIEISSTYTELLKAAGLTPLSLEIEATPIMRAVIDEKQIKDDNESIAVVDIGATRTSLAVYAQGSIQFTNSLPFSGDLLTTKIADELSLSHDQAEKAKIVCGLDQKKCDGALLKLLSKNIQDLSTKIIAAFDFYQREFEQSPEITRVLLCGGGAQFQGIDTMLSDKLKKPVAIANPFLHCLPVNKKLLPPTKALSYTTAIGLGLKIHEH